ncbi:MAG TPA: hypothetical protein VLZ81_14665 [Blastocatellia bacterium]|nr:hypothetical protein [Blastocatellia bacterium]
MLGRHEVHTIVQDLIYLRKWMFDPPDDEIRRGSAILRRLSVERELGNAWRSIGFEKEPRIVATDLEATTANRKAGLVVAVAGGGKYKGWACACLGVWKNDKPEERNTGPVESVFSLSEYLKSPSAFVEGETITRQVVIKYMANVRGGVHLKTTKARRHEKLFTSHIAKLEGGINAFFMNGLQYELLSIGQAVAQAPDAALLIETYGGRKHY